MNRILDRTEVAPIDGVLRTFITMALVRQHSCFAIITDRFEYSRMIQRSCAELLGQIPEWFFPKLVRMMSDQIELVNGSRLFFMNSCLQCKGSTLDALALADHVPWSHDDLACIIPMMSRGKKLNIIRFTE